MLKKSFIYVISQKEGIKNRDCINNRKMVKRKKNPYLTLFGIGFRI